MEREAPYLCSFPIRHVQICKCFRPVPVWKSGFTACDFWAVPATWAITASKPYILMDKICQRRQWFNTVGKSMMRCYKRAVTRFCPHIAEEEPRTLCEMGAFLTVLTGSREECTKGMCEGRGKRREEEICPFPQILHSLDLSFIFPTFSLAFFSCLFPSLSLLSSPLSRSPSHYLTFTASLPHLNSLYYGHLQSLLTCSSVCCSFPPSIFCHSPVVICNSENERENIGAASLSEPCSLSWLQFRVPATKLDCSDADWL